MAGALVLLGRTTRLGVAGPREPTVRFPALLTLVRAGALLADGVSNVGEKTDDMLNGGLLMEGDGGGRRRRAVQGPVWAALSRRGGDEGQFNLGNVTKPPQRAYEEEQKMAGVGLSLGNANTNRYGNLLLKRRLYIQVVRDGDGVGGGG